MPTEGPVVQAAPLPPSESADAQLDRLLQENLQLREKDDFLNRLLMAMTLLCRHRSIVSGDLSSALQDITRMAALSAQVQRASVWFLDDDRATLTCACIFDGLEGLHGEGARLSARDYPTYFTEIERGRVVAADHARLDPRTREFTDGYLLPLNISSMLDVPVKTGERLNGVVCLEHTGPQRFWLPEEKQFAAFVSSLVSLAIEASERIGGLERRCLDTPGEVIAS